MLADARAKAQLMIERLVEQQAQIEANPPKISPENLAAGRQAMNNAIAAARRTLAAIEAAIAAAPRDDEDDLPSEDELRHHWN